MMSREGKECIKNTFQWKAVEFCTNLNVTKRNIHSWEIAKFPYDSYQKMLLKSETNKNTNFMKFYSILHIHTLLRLKNTLLKTLI